MIKFTTLTRAIIVILFSITKILKRQYYTPVLLTIYVYILKFLINIQLFGNVMEFVKNLKKLKIRKKIFSVKTGVCVIAKVVIRLDPIIRMWVIFTVLTGIDGFRKILEILLLVLNFVYDQNNNEKDLKHQLEIFTWTIIIKILTYQPTWTKCKKLELLNEFLIIILKNILTKIEGKLNKEMKSSVKLLLFYLASFNFFFIVIPSLLELNKCTRFEVLKILAKSILWFDRLDSLCKTLKKIYTDE